MTFRVPDWLVGTEREVELLWEIERVLHRGGADSLLIPYEVHVGKSAWGSFESFLLARSPALRAHVAQRLQLVLSHLDDLASVEVVDTRGREPDEALRERIARRIVTVAAAAARVMHRERFGADEVRRWLSSIAPAKDEDLTGCDEGSLHTAVTAIDRA